MKVLILTTQFYQLNGAERLGVELAESLNAMDGVQADLASIYFGDLPGVPEAEARIRERGIRNFFHLGLRVNPRPGEVLGAIRRLRAFLREGQYDLVETSQITPAVLASWACFGLRTRHVEGIHDVFSRDRYNQGRHKIWRFSARWGRCDAFYAISEYARNYWIEYSATPPEKTVTILNAIPNDCYEAQPDRAALCGELGIPDEASLALFVGRMLKRKGIDTILEGLGPILEAGNVHMLYVGEWGYPREGFFPGEDTLQADMMARIQAEGWENRVHFLGRRNDVPRIMASCDVLVHPARIEGFGLVLAEAMAAGLPVVASTTQGIPEVVSGTDSLLVEPDDPEAFRAAVLTALRREAPAREQAVRRGRERAEAFRIDRRIAALYGLFQRLIAPHSENRAVEGPSV
jgi:glycosyltransferase involved in cell wall biosynthesis